MINRALALILVILTAAGHAALFLLGDRRSPHSLLDKRRDAAWAIFRGLVGPAGAWLIWWQAQEPMWLVLVFLFLPWTLYLIISGLADLISIHTRDRELLRQEKARHLRDELLMGQASQSSSSGQLPRLSGLLPEGMVTREGGERRDVQQRAAETARPNSAQSHRIPVERPSDAFLECWRTAGQHLDRMVQDGINAWLKSDPTPPFLEHLSFRLGNQLFFVRIEDVAGQVVGPGTRTGLLTIAEGCKGWPCIMPMHRYRDGKWHTDRPGWGLIDARTGSAVDPVNLVSDERIEMTDWELQDFAVQVVRDTLKSQRHRIRSAQGNPAVDPSIWFVENGQQAWVVVRAVRYPNVVARVPHNWYQISAGCASISQIGYFASVAVAGGEERPGERPDTRLLRGYPLYVRYNGLQKPTKDEIEEAEKDFIGGGRVASRHPRLPPKA